MKKLTITVAILTFIAANWAYPKIIRRLEIAKIEEQNQIALIDVQELSDSHYLDVDFICQAPLQTAENWEFHEESCEEAAVLQAINYQTKTSMSKEEANEVILDMIAWQEDYFGGHYDLYAPEMKEFISEYYDINPDQVEIIQNATFEDIKIKLNQDRPIIAPITGEILQNPYYPYPGYHMLTIVGYTPKHIITNDNGTMHGADFSYPIDRFMEALQDAGGNIITLSLIEVIQTRNLKAIPTSLNLQISQLTTL